jgi:leader peptidase (prepilin peptidase)/N-methyltransferase
VANLEANLDACPPGLVAVCRAAVRARGGGFPFVPAGLMAGGTMGAWLVHGPTLYLPAVVIACAMLLVLALIDARTGLLPDILTLPFLWLGLILAWAGHSLPLSDAVAGVIAGYGSLWILGALFQLLRRQEGMGYGDLKLFAALGAWVGWQALVLTLLVASLAAIAFAMAHQRRLRPRGAYPFGPFLASAALPALLSGSGVHSWF